MDFFPHEHIASLIFLGKKDKKKSKVPEKKEGQQSVKPQCTEVSLKTTPAPSKDDPPVKKSDTPPPIQDEDTQNQQPPPPPPPPSSSPNSDPHLLPSPEEDTGPPLAFPSSAYKKDRKLSSPSSRSPHTTVSNQPPEHSEDIMQQQTKTLAKKEGPTKSPSNEPRKKPQQHTQPSSVASSGSYLYHYHHLPHFPHAFRLPLMLYLNTQRFYSFPFSILSF